MTLRQSFVGYGAILAMLMLTDWAGRAWHPTVASASLLLPPGLLTTPEKAV